MKGFIGEYIEQLHIEKLRHRKVSAWTSMLALLVVFTVVWGLRVKGISLTNDTDCGIEEHAHDEGCYQIYQICGLSEGETEYKEVQSENGEIETIEVLHAHTDACFETELSCLLPEHVHTVACLDVELDTPENAGDSTQVVDENTATGIDEIIADEETSDELGDELEDGDESEDTDELEEDEELEEEILVENIAVDGVAFYASSYADPDQGMLSPAEMVRKAYEAHLEEMAKPESERDQTKIIKFGEFYVVTATGLRYKHKINEYLSGTTPAGGNRYTDSDGVYMQNAENDDFRYLLYDGAPLTLVVFREPWDNRTERRYIYTNSGGNYTVTNRDVNFSDGNSAAYARITGGDIGSNVTFSYETLNNGNDHFYVHKRNNSYDYYHPDIEIADGGFFKIETTRNYDDGSYQIVKTRYDSFVSEVYKSKIYFKNGTERLYPGVGVPNPNGPGLDPSDPDNQYCGTDRSLYQKNNEPGQTQYEITSAYNTIFNGNYAFKIEDVDHVIFTVELSLAPMESVIEKYDAGGNLISTTTKDFRKSDGSYDYIVTPLKVNLGPQSVVDAMNKCPNHTGMDFNLLYTEVNLDLFQPTNTVFGFNKFLDADNALGHSVSEFTFELLDDGGNVIDTIHPEAPSGITTFANQDFPIPGQYKYKVREVIPAGAVQIEPGVYYKDLVIYDGRVIDVVVDVSLIATIDGVDKPVDILAVVDDTDIANNTKLVATPHYFINGVEIDTSDPEEAKKLEFHNGLGEYSVKNLIVKKNWIGSGSHKDNITFRILRSRNGEDSQYYSIDEKTVFELNAGNGWQMEFSNLPVIIGTDAYSYDVVETMMLEYSPSYVREDYNDRIVYTINNIVNEDKYLYFKKIWTDEEGNTYVPPEDCDKVSVKLMREYKEIEVPVNVKIQPVGGGNQYSNEFVLSAYTGGSVEFKLETNPGEYYQLDLANRKNCDFTRDGDKYIISNIQPGAEIVLTYPVVTASDLIYWSTGGESLASGDGYGQWENNGGTLGYCYSTSWSDNGGSNADALSLLNRRADWNYAALNLDPTKCIPGESYSFSAYIMYRNESRADGSINPGQGTQVSEAPTALKIQLNYKEPNEDDVTYRDIAEVRNPVAGTWYQVQKTNFQIPAGARNIEIQVNTEERNRNTTNPNFTDYYVDLYFDDVIIAPYMYKAGVEQYSGNLTTTRLFKLVGEKASIPAAALNWTPEGQVKAFTIEKASGWEKSFKISDLGGSVAGTPELPSRSYRYYIIENPTIQNYKPIYLNDYVAHNDATTPITVENQYRAYVLPNTGGIGQNRIRWLGLLILLAGIPPALVNLVRKRGRPSG